MHHVIEVVVVGDGDQGVEILAGELVLKGDLGVGAESGEPGDHGVELDVAVNGEDLGLAADIGELVVVGTRVDLAAVAAHELGLVVGRLLLIVPRRRVLELYLPGARGRVAGIRIRVEAVVFHSRLKLGREQESRNGERDGAECNVGAEPEMDFLGGEGGGHWALILGECGGEREIRE